ncbi:MAG: hypothetical protein ACOCRX_08400 [Candidatus Woesearchaeota archaeon]
MQSGLKKLTKKDPVKDNIYLNPPFLHGGIYIFGKMNSGKTTAMLSIAQIYHDHPNYNFKIWDLYGGSRNEHLYWTLPSNKTKYWNAAKKILRLNHEGPKQYKVNLLYPLTSNLKINKLPSNPPYVNSKVFTIPLNNLDRQDIELCLGPLAENVYSSWRNIVFNNKKITPAQAIDKIRAKSGASTLYQSFFHPLINDHQLLQQKDCELNLDIKKEMNDTETISVLCLDFVPEEYKLTIIGYVMRNLQEILSLRNSIKRNILLMREVSEFFKVSNMSVTHDRNKMFKDKMSDWIRMGRRGMHPFLDTQSPSETGGIVPGQQDLTFLGRLPSENDRKLATAQPFRDDLINSKQIQELGKVDSGEFIVCPSGKKAYYQYFLLPKSRFWEEGNGNFYTSIWEKEGGRWTSFKEEKERLYNKYKEEMEEIEEEKRRKKEEERKRKEEEKRKKKEEERIRKEEEKSKKQSNQSSNNNIKEEVKINKNKRGLNFDI